MTVVFSPNCPSCWKGLIPQKVGVVMKVEEHVAMHCHSEQIIRYNRASVVTTFTNIEKGGNDCFKRGILRSERHCATWYCLNAQPLWFSSATKRFSGFFKTTLLSPISQSVLQLTKGNMSSNLLGRVTSVTGRNNCSSNSTQFRSHMPCGLGSVITTYKSRSPFILAIIDHPRSQFNVSSRYAMRREGPRQRYGMARIAQRKRSVRIEFIRCCGRRVGR
jgi:hypothetical protein